MKAGVVAIGGPKDARADRQKFLVGSWKTLALGHGVSLLGGEVEASAPSRYAALPPHAVTNFRP
jgi:hypothetical protein